MFLSIDEELPPAAPSLLYLQSIFTALVLLNAPFELASLELELLD